MNVIRIHMQFFLYIVGILYDNRSRIHYLMPLSVQPIQAEKNGLYIKLVRNLVVPVMWTSSLSPHSKKVLNVRNK